MAEKKSSKKGEARIISSPKTVNIAVTGRCNLKCRYCFYADEMTGLSDLSTEALTDFFKKLGDIGVMDVCLTGGEPFTRPDFFELIDAVISNRMRYSILSNGTLIDENTVRQFGIGKRRLRLNYIQVSIDGSKAEIHDLSRPGSFEWAERGLRLLKEAGLPVTSRVTINRHNLRDLEEIARLLLDDIGIAFIGTNDAMPVGSGCRNRDDVCLSAAEQLEAMKIIGRLLKRYPDRLNAAAGPQAKIGMYNQMEHARKTGEKAKNWKMGFLSACGCVFSTLDMLHDGTIVPCHMLPDLKLGHVASSSIEEIWHTHPTLLALRERRTIPMSRISGCRGCEWAAFCNGSCPGLTYELTGDVNQANPRDCYRRFLQETGVSHVV